MPGLPLLTVGWQKELLASALGLANRSDSFLPKIQFLNGISAKTGSIHDQIGLFRKL